jgi:hypothetical protein
MHPQVGPSLSTRIAFGAMLVADAFLVGYTINVLRSEMNEGPR